jgi:hypothetical protein
VTDASSYLVSATATVAPLEDGAPADAWDQSGGTYTDHVTSTSVVTCAEWFQELCVGSMSASDSSLGTGTTLTVQ